MLTFSKPARIRYSGTPTRMCFAPGFHHSGTFQLVPIIVPSVIGSIAIVIGSIAIAVIVPSIAIIGPPIAVIATAVVINVLNG